MKIIHFLAPTISALCIGVWALIGSGNAETAIIVFFMLSIVGSLTLLIFYPFILITYKSFNFRLPFIAVLGGIAAFLVNALVIFILPPRQPMTWSQSLLSEASIDIFLYGVATGLLFWLIRKYAKA
jgi:hypothetical protein